MLQKEGPRFVAASALALIMFPSLAGAEVTVLTSFSSGIVGGKSGAFPLTSSSIPADTQVAVGENAIVHLTNGAAGIYSKSGSLRQPLATLDQFWTAAGLSVSDGTFNPRVVYDPTSQHYYATSLDFPASGTNANNLLLAVSKTSDPLDGWQGYKIPMNVHNGDRFGDFDAIGFNGQGVFLSASSYESEDGPFVGTNTFALNKADLLSFPASLTVVSSYERSALQTGFNLQPIVDYDNGGSVTDANGRFLARYFSDSYAMSSFSGSLSEGTATYQASGQNVFASNEAPPPGEGATQKGTGVKIDAGDNRLGSSVIQRGGALYLVQGVTASGAQGAHAAIRLLILRASDNSVLLDQIISDPIHDLYYPSVAVNDAGDIVIGYSASGPDAYASAYAVAGKLNAARTAASFTVPLLLAAGQGTYDVPFGGGLNRWGDYSATWADPTDPTKFWTAQEYAIGKDQWSTHIAQISVGGLIAAPEPATVGFMALGVGCWALGVGRRVIR